MNNFLNTFYNPTKNTIVFGTLSNCNDTTSKYIVYCEPEYIPLTHLNKFLEGDYKKYLSFKTKKTLHKKVNLFLIFSTLAYLETRIANNSINIQKYFFPYYENIILKTKYWNVLSYTDSIQQLNLLYDTSFTPVVLSELECKGSEYFKEITNCAGLKIEINYDFYCPYYNSIRFVFQYQFF